MAKNKDNKGKKQNKPGLFSRLKENITGSTMRFVIVALLAILVLFLFS